MSPPIERLPRRVAAQLTEAGLGSSARVAVAVSGGVDSLVLLHALCTLQSAHPFAKLLALHVNHQLRSARSYRQDLQCIKRCLSSFDCPLIVCSVPRGFIMRYSKRKRISIEMAARELRYAQFRRIMRHYALDALLLAHHLDDQAETILMRLLQGEGVAGLQGIPPLREEQWHGSQLRYLRPLHAFSKKELINYAHQHHIRASLDSTNRSPRHLRNAIRRRLIPAIQFLFPGYRDSLQQLSQQLGEMLAYIKEQSTYQLLWEPLTALAYRIKWTHFCSAPRLLQFYSFYQLLNRSSPRRRIPRRFFDAALASLAEYGASENFRMIGIGYGIRLSLEGPWLYWRIEERLPAPLHYMARLSSVEEAPRPALIRIATPQLESSMRIVPPAGGNRSLSSVLLWFHCALVNDPLLIHIEIVGLSHQSSQSNKAGCLIINYRCILEDRMGQIALFALRQLAQAWSVGDVIADSRVASWRVSTHGEACREPTLPRPLQNMQQINGSLPDYGIGCGEKYEPAD